MLTFTTVSAVAAVPKTVKCARATRGSGGTGWPNSDEFSTDAATYRADLDEEPLDTRELLSAEAKLGESGRMGLPLQLGLPAQHRPESVTVDAEVTDVSRQSISDSTAPP